MSLSLIVLELFESPFTKSISSFSRQFLFYFLSLVKLYLASWYLVSSLIAQHIYLSILTLSSQTINQFDRIRNIDTYKEYNRNSHQINRPTVSGRNVNTRSTVQAKLFFTFLPETAVHIISWKFFYFYIPWINSCKEYKSISHTFVYNLSVLQFLECKQKKCFVSVLPITKILFVNKLWDFL